MPTNDQHHIYSVYVRALELKGEARSAFLAEVGPREPDVQTLVKRMLAASDDTDAWLRPGAALSSPTWSAPDHASAGRECR